MDRRLFMAGASGLMASSLLIGCAPAPSALYAPKVPPLPAEKHAEMIAGLKPPKRERPVVAVIVDEEGSETTDTIVPHAVLSLSNLADVYVVAGTTEPVSLFPALTIIPEITFSDFEQKYPEGADYVIVPASHRTKSPTLVPWIQQQARKNAIVIGICAGARTVAAAGLLDGRRGTTHWYEVDDLKKEEPGVSIVPDRRYVIDDGVVTTTGVTASIPVSLAIVEAIGGTEQAGDLASRLGVNSWTAAHDSSAFSVSSEAIWAALSGRIAFWNRATIGIPVNENVSAISLALAADAWSRTDRSKAFALSERHTVIMDSGLKLTDLDRDQSTISRTGELSDEFPAQSLDRTLKSIASAYGEDVARYVAVQVEYLRPRDEK